MKHLWISLALLLGVTLLLLANANKLTHLVQPMQQTLIRASQAAGQEDWDQAKALSQKALTLWENSASYLHLVQCHTDVDQVSILLRESQVFLQYRDPCGYAAANTQIIGALEDIRTLEHLSLGNLF
ncbi:MAG: DUF4363 family protein [Evtepia sp.]|uniref:DUF4363 family protein n=1 Tax=Evtepia sp. TaxID=2773933 RepID=UPI002A75FE5A|nr:DUF4363 family protein [Evtepia sp.]MDY3014240.1 DUF4363 family protein [Evtepia sp.]